MQTSWLEILTTSAEGVLLPLARALPRVLVLLALVGIGWVAALLARRLVLRLLDALALDARCARWGLTGVLARSGVRARPSELAGRLVFWTLLVVGVLMGLQALEMPGTGRALGVILGFIPHAVVAVLVVVTGWILAHVLGQAALIAVVNAQVGGAGLVAAAVRWLVLAFAAAVALTQLGIAREMVLLAFGIAFGGAVLALALAFGLGARELAREALEGWVRRTGQGSSGGVSHV